MSEQPPNNGKNSRAKFLESFSLSPSSNFEISRSMSAPPAEFLNSIQSLIDEPDAEADTNRSDFTSTNDTLAQSDPNYAAYFYSHSRFDPRLPPPTFYSPGQSWQMWPSSGGAAHSSSAAAGSLRPRLGSNFFDSALPEGSASGAESQMQRKRLVDMIQEDFPRTPSPVYAKEKMGGLQSSTELLDTEQDELFAEPEVFIKSRKEVNGTLGRRPNFTISGSVEAVMAAAVDTDLALRMDKLGFLEEVEDYEGNEKEFEDSPERFEQVAFPGAVPVPVSNTNNRWNKTAFPRSPVADDSSAVYEEEPVEVFTMNPIYRPNQHYTSYATGGSASAPVPAGKPYYPRPMAGRVYQAAAPMHPAPQAVSLARPAYFEGQVGDVLPDKYSILEDFRGNRQKKYELCDLKGIFVDLSTDQHGSRFIQQKLETASELEKDLVFAEIYPVSLQLMTDVFGNYVIQKFFEFGTTSQRVALVELMYGQVLVLSLQMYGCRVVQKALEHVPSDEQTRLVAELEGHVLRLVKDQNGNHVIQKCIECVPLSTNAPFLTNSFLAQASQLAMHPYGCRVIQRIFEHGTIDQTQALLDELLNYTAQLIQDQYGNYVIQHVLEHGKPADRRRIIDFLRGRLLEFSRHKFASNVVEKCVSFGSIEQRQDLIEEVLTPVSASAEEGSGDESSLIPLHLMMRDQFANYVVQKMLEVVDGEQREMLLIAIKPQLPVLRKYTYGKHILNKVERMLGLTPTVDAAGATNSAPTTPVSYRSNISNNSFGVINQRPGLPPAPIVKMPPRTAPVSMSVASSTLSDHESFPPLGASFAARPRRK